MASFLKCCLALCILHAIHEWAGLAFPINRRGRVCPAAGRASISHQLGCGTRQQTHALPLPSDAHVADSAEQEGVGQQT